MTANEWINAAVGRVRTVEPQESEEVNDTDK